MEIIKSTINNYTELVDKGLLQIVYEDLEYISKEWNRKDITDDNLRRPSVILRRLLCDGDLFKVAKSINFNRIRILDSIESDETFDDFNSTIQLSGGGSFNGYKIKDFKFYPKKLSADKIKNNYNKTRNKRIKPIDIKVYLNKPSIKIGLTIVSRNELIKYVNNKLGGAHYDNSRIIKRGKKEVKQVNYSLLDQIKDNMKLVEKNAIYFELLSIGQKIVNNKDISRLKKALKNYCKVTTI